MIVDLHLDLAMNALEWNRDLRLSIDEINDWEKGKKDKPDRGNATVSFPELRKGNIGLVVATMIARVVDKGSDLEGWHSPQQAWAQTQGQLAWYNSMEETGDLKKITSKKLLLDHLTAWNLNTTFKKPIGFVLSLEGADSLIDVGYLERSYQNGLRALGPAHYGPGRYANGTNASGKMNNDGVHLLKEMQRLGIILDVTHLCDDAFWQALDVFNGNVWASHNNCRSIVNHNRQFSDDMIKALLQRNAIIGAAMDAWMIVPDWQRGVSTPMDNGCNLERYVDHIDHICQIAGDSRHVSLGTDLDGAFGTEQCPHEISGIADLIKIEGVFTSRGYPKVDLQNLFYQNAIDFLLRALP
ncbi:MAG: dipeptidase [Chitinophagaceae bacterium]